MNKKLRLLVTAKCHNKCPMCCNKQFDFEKIPVVDRLDYDEISITGGEPLLTDCCGKTEEYREIKKYWASRLVNQQAESGEVLFDEFGGYCCVIGKLEYKPYTHVLFKNGYNKDSPRIEKEIESITIGKPKKGLCPDKWLDTEFFIIKFK